jgi:hypothetical protein
MINLTDLTDEFASPGPVSKPAIAATLHSILGRFYSAVVKSRQAEADKLVRRYLGQHDDAQLTRMGCSADEIKVIRAPISRPAAQY